MLSSFKILIFSLTLLSVVSGCVQQPPTSGKNTGSASTAAAPVAPVYQEPTFPLSGVFVQEGTTRTNGNFPLPVNFTDSFLLRGLTLSKFLRTVPSSTRFCVTGKYNHVVGTDRFILMAARPKSFTDLIKKTTEFYLQVEPSNDAANQNDCLNYNLSQVLIASGTAPTLSFSLTQLCLNCTTTITSTPLKLFFNNGEEVSSVVMGSILMSVSGSIATATNSCVESSLCRSRGFDCCLQGQCVKDGAIKPNVLTDPNFLPAQTDVASNPSRFILYPQFYFVCEARPEPRPVGSGTLVSPIDPNYDASIRMMEFTHLYNCLNQVEGEFSYCTVKIPEASKIIPGVISPSTYGFKDDINFTTLNPNYLNTDFVNNIVKVLYGGKVIYEFKKTAINDATFVVGTTNDSLFSSQSINITSVLPSNALDDNLYISYKIDGTCEKLSSSLARCKKTYIQTASEIETTTWHDNGKTYYLPHYADLSSSANLTVKIGGVIVPEDSATWSKGQSPNRVIFNGGYQIFQNQKIEITYFVTANLDALLKSKTAAQVAVNTMCTCTATSKCNLKPILNDSKVVTNYECTYPVPESDLPPINQTVYVSNKNVPHRYYDVNGVGYDSDFATALPQEGGLFEYTNNNTLKPNNLLNYVGFNEIYGSFSKTGTFLAKPAKHARVKKDQTYDIVVSSGVFSSCTSCGSDYYTAIQRIFPQNFAGAGGGYTPDYYENSREANASIYRGDDLLYGRACFLPATMIPWTHITSSEPKLQRRTRLAGQHFLFANGYNRDWYGFDYGSIIGSFDGFSWFSVGNQRRIKASSGKLFLAVNAYFGDMAVDNNFTVIVSETNAFSSPIPTHDSESDGAECQRAHYCTTDKQCFTNLGYDYTCQSVGGLTTTWPTIDVHGSEVVGSVTKSLASVVGGTFGIAKRCVYRGRGAPCHKDLTNTASTFNGAIAVGHLACSSNNYCLSTTESGFNDRVARFANTPATQNIAEVTTPLSDIIGLGARIIGRPFDYYGSKAIPATAGSSLGLNNVKGVCVPGKEIPTTLTNYQLNSQVPSSRPGTSDKLFGIGTTLSGSPTDARFLSACPATDDKGISVHLSSLNLGDEGNFKYTRSQNLSTNHLAFAPLITAGIYSVNGSSIINKIGYQRNACLRGAGATCFADMDCGPSGFLAHKVKTTLGLEAFMNPAEKSFWEEELVCGNPRAKLGVNGGKNPEFDVKQNRCCREFGKDFTVYTETQDSTWHWCDTTPDPDQAKVAGVNVPINSINRYSRVHTAYDKYTCNKPDSATLDDLPFALSIKGTVQERMARIKEQYLTLDATNSRTCCTTNWVRSFSSVNGGGHAHGKTKIQDINVEMFREVNWFKQNHFVLSQNTPTNDPPFLCLNDGANHRSSACEVRTFTDDEAKPYLEFAASLELIGIQQVAIKTTDEIFKVVTDPDDQGLFSPPPSPAPASALGQQAPPINNLPLNHTINALLHPVTDQGDFRELNANGGARYYSAGNYGRFKSNIKQIFSEHEFSCCLPANTELGPAVTAGQCCTGAFQNVRVPKTCCLPDYADVSLYLNRYVSSEGRGLPENAYDPKTGYIIDPNMVIQIAMQKNLCCSGAQPVTGVALSELHVPLADGSEVVSIPGRGLGQTSRRFIYRTDSIDSNGDSLPRFAGELFAAGLRWNNHVYCVRSGFTM
ncbi:MAG TPA: hypothetical protein VNJ08_17310 [Bacteriovoracaceae bacterium]|nr:hypothetical protein [Bacteriovoracaceae bacterium]